MNTLGRRLAALVLAALASVARAQESPPPEDSAADQQQAIAFDEQPYRVKVLCSFANDAALSDRLRSDVLRRFRSHVAAYVGLIWEIEVQDASEILAAATASSIGAMRSPAIQSHAAGFDKVFVLGVMSGGDQFPLAAREYDVLFDRWGPLFEDSAREPGQIARDLLLLCARMFSPTARIEGGDARRVELEIKGGSLPGLRPRDKNAKLKYPPSFDATFIVENRTWFRPMLTLFSEDDELVSVRPIGWTFYEVERRDGPAVTCRVKTALTMALPPPPPEPNIPQAIVARTANGTTRLRVVEQENLTPLPAIDVEVRFTDDGATIPIGTTNFDGAIEIEPSPLGLLVWAYVRHGRDLLAKVPLLPGAGEEPDLPRKPDPVRLDIEGHVVAVQEQVIDQVARRVILEAFIREDIKKKKWEDAGNKLRQLKASPNKETMEAKLEAAKEYARQKRPEDQWTGKVKRLFGETADIVREWFDPDKMEDKVLDLEDELQSETEAAQATAQVGGAAPQGTPSPPAATAPTPPSSDAPPETSKSSP